jgi:hypothetical protein
MFDEKKKTSLVNRCALVSTPAQPQQQQDQPRVNTLTQMGPCMAGEQAITLSCILERLLDESGNFRGQIVYPVVGEIQHDPGVARLQRAFEFRGAIKTDGPTGLVYRMLPSHATGANSWLTSAESAMHSLVGTWGRVTSDRNAGVYRFERLNLPAQVNNSISDVDELIDELLADYVIDSLDHPVLQRLLNQSSSQGNQGYGFTTTAAADEEDNDEVY